MPKKSAMKKLGSKKAKTPRSTEGRVSVPQSIGTKITTSSPSILSAYSGDGRVRVRHREYIADIAGSVAFAATSFVVNPGIVGTFPWLSVLAANFESYKFNSLCFQFSTEKSASTNGSLMIAVDYDANDAAPATKTVMMAYHNAVRCPVWSETKYVSDKQDLMKLPQRYIRAGAVSGTDLKTYDVGNLFIATAGCADTTALGELYVIYDVELITPQL